MSASIISIRGVGKRFVLGESAGHDTLRDHLAAGIRSLIGRKNTQNTAREHWALRNVSFDVNEGEIVGIIGHNGAGKSTLLKILSQISEPTEGEIRIRGRIASLLEVGTGFHPELTGRENIFLNGAILGMTRAEIRSKFDEIIAFAEVEKFLDTPVKRYSSGMYVRLAFAVAAHLEPEILVIDEVLAVGDASFQKKCLGKMDSIARQGRTVLFVSHNMAAIRQLCSRCLLLHEGQIVETGDSATVTESYFHRATGDGSAEEIARQFKALPQDNAMRLDALTIRQHGKSVAIIQSGAPMEVEIRWTVLERTPGLRVFFDLLDHDQILLVRTFNDDHADTLPTMEAGSYISVATLPANLLAPRAYELRVHGTIFNVRRCTGEGVAVPLIVETTSGINRAYPQEPIRAKLQPYIPWQTTQTHKTAEGRLLTNSRQLNYP